MLGKIISLIIALGYLITIMVKTGGAENFVMALVLIIPPLALIWFAEELGNYMGPMGGSQWRANYPSPAWLIRIFGWLFLLAPLLIAFYVVIIKRQSFF